MSEKKLFLLDAFALIYRGYFALNANPSFKPVNSKGVDTSAILGFVNTLTEVLNREKPTHIAVVFDTAAPTQRHEDYADYKANRDEMPDAIGIAIPYIHQILEAFRIPILAVDGYEADDVIGTLAKKAKSHGFTTYMMTPDKDFGQLVEDGIYIYRPGRQGSDAEIWGVKEVCAKFDLARPELVIDYLGLTGDAVDNIPGIPGVGPKTAVQFLKDFGSVENLLQNTDKLKGKMKEKVEANAQQALMSKKLATIMIDAPVDIDEEDLRLEEPDRDKVLELFSELEFRSLAKRVLGAEIQNVNSKGQIDMFGNGGEANVPGTAEVSEYLTIESVPHNYMLSDTAEKIDELVKKLSAVTSFCFDSETTGLDPLSAEIVGLSFSFKKAEAYYVPFPANRQAAQEIILKFKPLFENENIEKVGQNIKFDIAILSTYGIQVKGKLFDTMLAHYLLKPDGKHGMDYLAETYLSYRPVSIETLIGKKGKSQLSMRDVPVEQIKEYAAEDADITWQLKEIFEPMLKENSFSTLYDTVEGPLVPVLEAMEREGVNIDVQFLKSYSQELGNSILQLQEEIFSMAGTQFNLNSPQQLGSVLFEHLKIDEKAKKTKTGQYATNEDVLSKLAAKHPIIPKILDYRELTKLKSTYVDSLPEMVNPITGRVHTSFMQAVAATGRLSSNNPNLQNIPIRTEKGREIRKAFIPRDKNHVLLSADYSQIELRVIAALSKDKNMQEAFRSGEDIHQATAAKVFGVALTEVTKDQRSAAKAVNFGIIYGQSAFGLSQNLGIPVGEAKEIIENYFKQYPGIKKYMEENVNTARKEGYVTTIAGRKRYLPDINSGNAVVRGFAERNAINAPIQGSAADMIKIAMIKIHHALKENGFKSKMLLQVHDELVFDVLREELDAIKPVIKENMENAVKLEVPIVAEMDMGENWLEAH